MKKKLLKTFVITLPFIFMFFLIAYQQGFGHAFIAYIFMTKMAAIMFGILLLVCAWVLLMAWADEVFES